MITLTVAVLLLLLLLIVVIVTRFISHSISSFVGNCVLCDFSLYPFIPLDFTP